MLQSPTSLFPDPSFRLQALVHGRTYLSPTAHSGHQPPGGAIDPAQYRAAGLMYQSHHRLPHFSLAIPPGDILPQYQSHVIASPFSSQPGGFHPSLVSSVRRASFQGPPQPQPQPQPLESYSQTLFNLSHQTHHHPQALPHTVGPLSLQQSSSVRPSIRAGPSASGGQSEEGAVIQDRTESSFSLRAMPNYFEAVACEGRLPGRGPVVREMPLRPIGVPSQRVRHQPTQIKQHLVSGEDATVPHVHSYQSPQHLPHHNHHQQQHHHLLPRLPRISTTTTPTGRGTTPTHNNNNNNNNDDDSSDKDAAKLLMPARVETPRSWKSPTLTSDDLSEVEFSFKNPNAVGVHHPSDRPPLRSNPSRYSSNLGLPSSGSGVGSPSGCHQTNSPSSFSVHQMSSSSPKESGSPSSSSSSYHRHFLRGSVIQLASGQLKRVEDLRTEDFLDSCGISAELSVDMSRVTHVRMNHDTGCVIIGFAVGKKQIQVTVEAIVDHPFFVFNRGWSSCCPSKTLDRYGLPCHQLIVGDICISLTHRYPNSPGPSSTSQPFASSKPPFTLDHKGAAAKTGPSVSSLLQGGPLLATVDPCPLGTSTGSRSPPSQPEKVALRTVPELAASTNGHSSAGRVGVSRKRRWSAPDEGERESSPTTTPNTSKIPFKVPLTSLPSVAF